LHHHQKEAPNEPTFDTRKGNTLTSIRITRHAVDRFQERVLPGSSKLEARLALQQFVSMGRLRPNARHWMSDQRPDPEKRFIYWAGHPRVCAIIVGRTVVTVITADLVRASGLRNLRPVASSAPQQSHGKSERWRWDGLVEASEAETTDREAA
jgi:hypothetical protein